MNIPIIIVCYNNFKYVDNTIKQLAKINEDYSNNIIILNNCSDDIHTMKYLLNSNHMVIHNDANTGPWITQTNNINIYNMMPDKFIITDPDLEFNEKLPSNFIDILSSLSDDYKCNKIGFALDISDFENMYTYPYCQDKNIHDWEKQFWNNKIDNKNYDLYNAAIDTTFCLINKNAQSGNIRIAGNFIAKHIPWYINNKLYNVYDNYMLNINMTNISTISKLVVKYVNENYLKINKKRDFFNKK